jgi:hypothetical protein
MQELNFAFKSSGIILGFPAASIITSSATASAITSLSLNAFWVISILKFDTLLTKLSMVTLSSNLKDFL